MSLTYIFLLNLYNCILIPRLLVLISFTSGALNNWLKENNLHKRLWESLVDGESYVRATSLQALPALVGCKALWEDVLSCASITQVIFFSLAAVLKNYARSSLYIQPLTIRCSTAYSRL